VGSGELEVRSGELEAGSWEIVIFKGNGEQYLDFENDNI
jgi:hypothetical protein